MSPRPPSAPGRRVRALFGFDGAISPPIGDDEIVPVELGREEFEELVGEALDEIPDEIAVLIRNVVVLVEDNPPADDPTLLGMYDGVALPDRIANHTGLPDRIFIFRNPLLDMCEDLDDLSEEVRITVVHEVAHHFGIDDARLHDLGYA